LPLPVTYAILFERFTNNGYVKVTTIMEKVRIIVVDDHPLFRQGVIDSFSLEEDFLIVGQADNGEEALKLIRELRPDVAVLDVNSVKKVSPKQMIRIIRIGDIPASPANLFPIKVDNPVT
jgi:AmiR/NasT family two-component response regulator